MLSVVDFGDSKVGVHEAIVISESMGAEKRRIFNAILRALIAKGASLFALLTESIGGRGLD